MGRGSKYTFSQRQQTNGQQVHEKMLRFPNHQGNANQNHNEITSHLLEWLLSKYQEIMLGYGEKGTLVHCW